MGKIKNWYKFNESNNSTLLEIFDKLNKVSELSDVKFGNAFNDYLHFVLNDKLFFSVSITDNNRTIIVLVERDGISESVGSYNMDQLDLVVEDILNQLKY